MIKKYTNIVKTLTNCMGYALYVSGVIDNLKVMHPREAEHYLSSLTPLENLEDDSLVVLRNRNDQEHFVSHMGFMFTNNPMSIFHVKGVSNEVHWEKYDSLDKDYPLKYYSREFYRPRNLLECNFSHEIDDDISKTLDYYVNV